MKKRVAKRIFVLMTMIVSFLLIGTFLVSEVCESIAFADIKNGGGFFVGSSSNVTLSGLTIQGHTAEKGGGVYVADGGTLTMNGTFDSNLTRIDAEGNEDENGDYVLFGSYPKTYQSDISVITNKTDENGYYIGTDGTSRFAKVESANPYNSSYVFDDETIIVEGETYYFKVEPLKWRILSIQDGKALLFCEEVVDVHEFYSSRSSRTINGSTIYANNYKYSDIRAWLNGYGQEEGNTGGEDWLGTGFLQKAFTIEQREIIQTTEVDNSVSTTFNTSNPYVCENTNDKIFLPSYQEITNTEYGFYNGMSDMSETQLRRKKTTDLSRANSVSYYTSSEYLNGWYWLRSPCEMDNYCVNAVTNTTYSSIDVETAVTNSYVGVVPALWLDLGEDSTTASFSSNSKIKKEVEDEGYPENWTIFSVLFLVCTERGSANLTFLLFVCYYNNIYIRAVCQ